MLDHLINFLFQVYILFVFVGFFNCCFFFVFVEFLQIDISDKLLVRNALGYQRDVDLFTGKAQDLSTLLTTSTSCTSLSGHTGPIISEEDKNNSIRRLKAAIGKEEEVCT